MAETNVPQFDRGLFDKDYMTESKVSLLVAQREELRKNIDSLKRERDQALASLKEAESNALKYQREFQKKAEEVSKQRKETGHYLLTELSEFKTEIFLLKEKLEKVRSERDDALRLLQEAKLVAIKKDHKAHITEEEANRQRKEEGYSLLTELSNVKAENLLLRENYNKAKNDNEEAQVSLKKEQSKAIDLTIQLAITKAGLDTHTDNKLLLEKTLDATKKERDNALALLKNDGNALTSHTGKEYTHVEAKPNGLPKLPSQKENIVPAEEIRRLTAEISSLKEQNRAVKDASEKVKASLEEQLIEGRGELRRMHNLIQELKGNIRVFVRLRPFLPSDDIDEDAECSIVPISETSLKVNRSNERKKAGLFSVDRVFSQSASQKQIFTEASELVQSALDGYNVCLFSYGQTGSGKTYTMEGRKESEMRGIIPRAIEQISEYKAKLESTGWQYTMQVSIIEIYRETIHDLLRENEEDKYNYEVKLSKDGKERYVSNITMIKLDPSDDKAVKSIMRQAKKRRSVASTKLNATSSRSHSVFTLHISALHQKKCQSLRGALNLVDLAGSERLDLSKVTGERAKETMAINKSLSALTHVFSAIANKDSHIPFRDSTLTKLLEPSFSGCGKTLMLVTLNPTNKSVEESLCSLRFASNVKQCKLGKAKRSFKYIESSNVEDRKFAGKNIEPSNVEDRRSARKNIETSNTETKKSVGKKSKLSERLKSANSLDLRQKHTKISRQGTAEKSSERGHGTKTSNFKTRPMWK